MKKIVIVGATSSIAEHCARLWVTNATIQLVLIGRDLKKITRVANDLRVRSPESLIQMVQANFTDPLHIKQITQDIIAEGAVDLVLIAHGALSNQKECEQDLIACQEALTINGISPILFAEAFVASMEKENNGTLAIIGSVAGDRGRKSNYIYGAAKGMLERYTQGVAHRLAKTNVNIILIKPGPTDTPMTHEIKQKGMKLASVETVAEDIVKKIEQRKPIIYTPIKWAMIMMIIRNLPRCIFNKMEI